MSEHRQKILYCVEAAVKSQGYIGQRQLRHKKFYDIDFWFLLSLKERKPVARVINNLRL